MGNVGLEGPFQMGDTPVAGALSRQARHPRKVVRQAVIIDHGGHRHYTCILQEVPDLAAHLGIAGDAASELPSGLDPLGGEDRRVKNDVESQEMGAEDVASERLLCLALHQDVDTLHDFGRPPSTFFSQSSPSE